MNFESYEHAITGVNSLLRGESKVLLQRSTFLCNRLAIFVVEDHISLAPLPRGLVGRLRRISVDWEAAESLLLDKLKSLEVLCIRRFLITEDPELPDKSTTLKPEHNTLMVKELRERADHTIFGLDLRRLRSELALHGPTVQCVWSVYFVSGSGSGGRVCYLFTIDFPL